MSISFANNDMQQEDIQSKKRVSVASQERASPCLLTLPPENRSMIYEYAAAGAELTYATEGDHTATALSNHFGMLRICKLVTHEARPILYWAMQVTVNSWSKIYAELNQRQASLASPRDTPQLPPMAALLSERYISSPRRAQVERRSWVLFGRGQGLQARFQHT